MVAESRLEDDRLGAAELAAQLTTDPSAFEFFQAVHLLERLFPERRPVGGFGDRRCRPRFVSNRASNRWRPTT